MRYITFLIFGLLLLSLGCKPEPVAEPVISIADVSIEETNANQKVQVDLSIPQAAEFDISFEAFTKPQTATEADFISVDTILFIRAGSTNATIEVTIVGDDLPEDDEFFEIVLSDPFNATFDRSSAIITITNDDDHTFRIPETGYTTAASYDGMVLAWEEGFDGPNLNTADWTYELGDGCDKGICGWGNNELQYYTQENTSIVDGNLVIEAKKESRGGKAYTSSRIITQGKKEFQYGRIDIRAVMPYGQGMWPALWMLGTNINDVSWPACGEIDIMEMVGGADSDGTTHGTVHWDNAGNYASFGNGTSLENGKLSDEFHVYSIEWTEGVIKWLLDDEVFHQIDISPDNLSEFRQPFFFIMNIAVGGNWPGSPDATTVFSQWMIVDYIRVFQPE